MDIPALKNDVTDKVKLLRITNQIHMAENLDEIFFQFQSQILELFDAERITIYAVDSNQNELFSRFKVGDGIKEIRVKIDKKSISGFVAYTKTFINIADAYDKDELKRHDSELNFNQKYDMQTGFRTKQVLASAILFQKELLGVIQLINKKSGGEFGLNEVLSLKGISSTLAIAFRNQEYRQKMLYKKFSALVQKNLITENDLTNIIGKSKKTLDDIILILRRECGIAKNDILDSLSKYYYCPFTDYDPKIVIGETLLKGLDLKYCIEKLWTPFRKINGRIEVLIDDPGNIKKINEIKACLDSSDIHLIGALPEDILKYLHGITRTK